MKWAEKMKELGEENVPTKQLFESLIAKRSLLNNAKDNKQQFDQIILEEVQKEDEIILAEEEKPMVDYYRSTLPTCLASSTSKDWEISKTKSIEKLSKQHVKEVSLLKQEDAEILTKLNQELALSLTQLERDSAGEDDSFLKNIQQKRTNLKELQRNEKENLIKNLQKNNKAEEVEFMSKLDSKQKKIISEFEKQIIALQRNIQSQDDQNLINSLIRARRDKEKRENHYKELEELRLIHNQKMDELNQHQDFEKQSILSSQQLEREILIEQLSLGRKQLREKLLLKLEEVRKLQSHLRNRLEARHRLNSKQENDFQDLVMKLLLKQQTSEMEHFTKSLQANNKSASSTFQKQKKSLKDDYLAELKGIQKEKISKEEKNVKTEECTANYQLNVLKLQKDFENSLSSLESEQLRAIHCHHEQQLKSLNEELKKRRDFVFLNHQLENNSFQEKAIKEFEEAEKAVQRSFDEYEGGELKLKEAYTVRHSNCLLNLQERHWKEIDQLQSTNHSQQQEFIKKCTPSTADLIRSLSIANIDSNLRFNSVEINTIANSKNIIDFAKEEEEEEAKKEEELKAVQEREWQILHIQREKEQEKLYEQIEVEKQSLLTEVVPQPTLTPRSEYIRKIANDTGLSEEMIAKQLGKIGFQIFDY